MPSLLTSSTAVLHKAFDLLNPADGSGPVASMVYRTKVEGYVNPATGEWVAESNTDVDFYGLRYSFTWIERQNMKDFEEGDAKVILKNPAAFVPMQAGYVVLDDVEWNIISIRPDALGATYILQIRLQT